MPYYVTVRWQLGASPGFFIHWSGIWAGNMQIWGLEKCELLRHLSSRSLSAWGLGSGVAYIQLEGSQSACTKRNWWKLLVFLTWPQQSGSITCTALVYQGSHKGMLRAKGRRQTPPLGGRKPEDLRACFRTTTGIREAKWVMYCDRWHLKE